MIKYSFIYRLNSSTIVKPTYLILVLVNLILHYIKIMLFSVKHVDFNLNIYNTQLKLVFKALI